MGQPVVAGTKGPQHAKAPGKRVGKLAVGGPGFCLTGCHLHRHALTLMRHGRRQATATATKQVSPGLRGLSGAGNSGKAILPIAVSHCKTLFRKIHRNIGSRFQRHKTKNKGMGKDGASSWVCPCRDPGALPLNGSDCGPPFQMPGKPVCVTVLSPGGDAFGNGIAKRNGGKAPVQV
ncbi:hypothetical protein GCM10007928_43430 [Sulfitobacter porphyrae]|nr:hypothetical protein GCM10007928_43430 [Sulfitobacter porphyrae]